MKMMLIQGELVLFEAEEESFEVVKEFIEAHEELF